VRGVEAFPAVAAETAATGGDGRRSGGARRLRARDRQRGQNEKAAPDGHDASVRRADLEGVVVGTGDDGALTGRGLPAGTCPNCGAQKPLGNDETR
jgi:hypothetical protein